MKQSEIRRLERIVKRKPYMIGTALVASIVSLILLIWSIVVIFSNLHNLSLILYVFFMSLYTFIFSLIFTFGLKNEIKERRVYYVEYS